MLVLAAIIGVLLIVGFTRYRQPLLDWLAADPAKLQDRVNLVFFVSVGLLTAPLLAFAVYLWSFGVKIARAGRFPPPNHRMVANVPVLTGEDAVRRGRTFKTLAMFLSAAALLLWLLLWRLAALFAGRAL